MLWFDIKKLYVDMGNLVILVRNMKIIFYYYMNYYDEFMCSIKMFNFIVNEEIKLFNIINGLLVVWYKYNGNNL